MDCDEAIIADNLSDVSESQIDSDNDNSDSDSDSSFIENLRGKITKPIISRDSDSEYNDDSEEENTQEFSEIDEAPTIEPFLSTPHVTVAVDNPENLKDVISLFIDEDFFDLLRVETNRYHKQNINKFKNQKNTKKWENVTSGEMKKMLGLILLMGKVRKDTRDEYWSTDSTIETPLFSKVMSRNRFRQSTSSLHFANNENITDESDKLFKVLPVLNYFIPKFKDIYKPQRELSLDECIIPWRGRLSFKVYNASKIVKYGILVRMLCEATSGYICNLDIYCAKGLKLKETVSNVVTPHFNLWHHLYMDNFYNSVELSELLLQHKVRICGTIRVNRGLPICLKTVKLNKGESTFRRKKDVLIQIWKYKRDVRIISTIHSAEMQESRNTDWTTKEKIIKPVAVIDYNKYMKGVDRADQYIYYFKISRKTKKWTNRVFIFMINCALFNAYRVFDNINTKKMKYKKFLHEVARMWITDEIEKIDNNEEEPEPSQTKRTPKFNPPTRLSLDMKKHVLEKY